MLSKLRWGLLSVNSIHLSSGIPQFKQCSRGTELFLSVSRISGLFFQKLWAKIVWKYSEDWPRSLIKKSDFNRFSEHVGSYGILRIRIYVPFCLVFLIYLKMILIIHYIHVKFKSVSKMLWLKRCFLWIDICQPDNRTTVSLKTCFFLSKICPIKVSH